MVACPYPEDEWVQRFAEELCTLQRGLSLAEACADGRRLWPRYGIFVPEPTAHCHAADLQSVEMAPDPSRSRTRS